MTRREFVNSVVGEHRFLWLDQDELRQCILRTFEFADRNAGRDLELVRLLREAQVNGIETGNLEDKVDAMIENRLKFYNRKKKHNTTK